MANEERIVAEVASGMEGRAGANENAIAACHMAFVLDGHSTAVGGDMRHRDYAAQENEAMAEAGTGDIPDAVWNVVA